MSPTTRMAKSSRPLQALTASANCCILFNSMPTELQKQVRSLSVRDRQDAYLDVLAESITDVEACAAAGVSRRTVYRWVAEDTEGFNERLLAIEPLRGKNLESLMFTVLHWATAVEERYEKMLRYPSLLQFALRGLMPEKYGYKLGGGQDEARRVLDQLMAMRDDPKVRVADGATLEAELDAVLGSR